MLITGHRGAPGRDFPENTLASFRHALQSGATAIELDVHRCKTGEMVVIHDNDVSRTTDGTGKVSKMTLDEIKQLDAGNGEQV
ncbi:MAG: glycerophosphodiester phosphodiesterase, partial [Rickettsiales bacterium]